MPSSLIAPVVGAGVSFGLNKLFGGSSSAQAPLQSFAPAGINAGGLSTTFSGGNIGVTPSADRLGFVSDVSNTFSGLGDALGELRSKVAPGISDLRASRLAEIENARTRAIGDLRENLQRRRVLGSSFGADAISRAEAEFGSAKAKVAGETFLQELEASNQLITQQFGAYRSAVQTRLDELNLEANVAATLAGKTTETLGANARLMAQLNALEAQNAGKFFGGLAQPIGKAAAGLFGGSGGSGAPIDFGGATADGSGIIGVGPLA